MSVLTSLTFNLRVLSLLLCKERERERERERETETETDRQTDRQTDRDRGRQRGTETGRERHTEQVSHVTVDSPAGDTMSIITVSYINKPEAGQPRTMSKGCG